MPDPGWIGFALGQCVAVPQLLKILRNKDVSGISTATYGFLVGTVFFYFVHALQINDTIFAVSNSISLITNGLIFILILKYRKKSPCHARPDRTQLHHTEPDPTKPNHEK